MIRRIGLGLFILAAFGLLGWNAELRRRVGRLEEDLARRPTERKRAVAEPKAPPPEPEPERGPTPTPEPVPAKPVEVAPPPPTVARVLRSAASRPFFTAVMADGSLSPEQRAAIVELKRSADEQTRAAREVIEQIERSTETAMRNLLTNEQLARLDSGRVVAWETSMVAPGPGLGSRSGYLGVVGQDAPGGGVQLGQVMPGTAAAAGGLQPGDVILELDGRPVGSYVELLGLLQSRQPGTPLSVRIRRGQAEFYQGFQLGNRP